MVAQNSSLPKENAVEIYIQEHLSPTLKTSESFDLDFYRMRLTELVSREKDMINIKRMSWLSKIAFKDQKFKEYPKALAKGFNLMNEGNTIHESIELYFLLKYSYDFKVTSRRFKIEESEEAVAFFLREKLIRYADRHPEKVVNAGFFTTCINNHFKDILERQAFQTRDIVFVEHYKLDECATVGMWEESSSDNLNEKVATGLQILEDLMENHKNPHWFKYLMDFTSGMTYLEIAAKYNAPKGSVMSGLCRARNVLREKLMEIEEND